MTSWKFDKDGWGTEVNERGVEVIHSYPEVDENATEVKELLESPQSTMANPYVVIAALSILLKEVGTQLKVEPLKISELNLGEASPYEVGELEKMLVYLSDFPNLEGKSQVGGVDEVNSFLKDKGFSIQLEPISSTDIAVAVVNTIEVEYETPGKRIEDHALKNGNTTVGAHLSAVRIFDAKESFTGNEIIYVPVAGGGYMALSQMDNGISEKDLWNSVKDFTKKNHGVEMNTSHNGEVAFPMVNLTLKRELDYLMGVNVGGDYFIGQAKAESKLKVNHKKAISKTAVALGTFRGMSLDPYVKIDGNFVLWFVSDKGLPADPYYITEEGMGEPEMKEEDDNA